jgi:SOS-response transcriptional repressor LexA
MQSWNEVVRGRMRDMRITQESLAEKIGVSQGAVAHWLTGRREPDLKTIQRLLSELGLPPLLIGGGKQPGEPPLGISHPVMSESAILAAHRGEPSPATTFLPSEVNAGPRAFWFTVRGNSMISPVDGHGFPSGMHILVQTEGFYLIPEKFYVVMLSPSDIAFRQYVRDAGDGYLRALNPEFRMIRMRDDMLVLGRVVDAKMPSSIF